MGLSADSRCIIESRAHSGPHHNCQHPEAPWHRPSTGAKSENDMEGVSHSTLGSDRCNRLLYRGGVDLFWIDALHRPFSLWICRHEGANWRHRQLSKWAVDGSDCTQSNGCRGWFLRWKTIFDPRSRSVVHREFLTTLGTVGIESVKLPPRSPNLNAYAERFVRTIKESCLEQMIFFGKEGLRNAVREFVTHYHLERNHQGLDNRLIIPTKTTMNATARPHASIFGPYAALSYVVRPAKKHQRHAWKLVGPMQR